MNTNRKGAQKYFLEYFLESTEKGEMRRPRNGLKLTGDVERRCKGTKDNVLKKTIEVTGSERENTIQLG